ncbi:Uncharacterised protein [Raoultella terrigena]|uniref:Uncharacterized protein n=1 Tax=Raoultella terrigena TaxID=577 RepID=A0A4U9D199_RAOTE|nr:Uncharacterised protein [Raoultella terrigena]
MIRVLFCIGVNQNFFDATPEVGKQVWAAFGEMMNGIANVDGVTVIGNMDDDRDDGRAPQPAGRGPPTCWPTRGISRRLPPPAICFAACRSAAARTGCGNIAKSKPVPGEN